MKKTRSRKRANNKGKTKTKYHWCDRSPPCITLLFVCILQFLLIIVLWMRGHNQDINIAVVEATPLTGKRGDATLLSSPNSTNMTQDTWDGVAACLMLDQPEWFQRRYTNMVRNVRDNIPASWGIQIFYIDDPQTRRGFEINRGLQRMNESGLITLNLIPQEISIVKTRSKELWTDRWLWANMRANRVLIFGGHSVICGNSPFSVETFSNWDYIGSPRGYVRTGGDDGISIRNRDAMLKVLDFEKQRTPEDEWDTAYRNWGLEDHFFVSRMVEMNQQKMASFRIANQEASQMFGAIGGWISDKVFCVSGTLEQVPHQERENFFTYCPELQTVFPALHDPHCFGASTWLDYGNNTKLCAASICALQDSKLHPGGC